MTTRYRTITVGNDEFPEFFFRKSSFRLVIVDSVTIWYHKCDSKICRQDVTLSLVDDAKKG